MSKVSQLIGKGEKIEFETENGKVEFLIKPLKNKELLEVVELAEKKDNKSMLIKLMYYSLQKDDPTITEKEIEDMDTSFLLDILKIITKVNRLEGMFDFQVGGQSSNPPALKKPSREELLQDIREKAIQNH